jgi:hypothetical protein
MSWPTLPPFRNSHKRGDAGRGRVPPAGDPPWPEKERRRGESSGAAKSRRPVLPAGESEPTLTSDPTERSN